MIEIFFSSTFWPPSSFSYGTPATPVPRLGVTASPRPESSLTAKRACSSSTVAQPTAVTSAAPPPIPHSGNPLSRRRRQCTFFSPRTTRVRGRSSCRPRSATREKWKKIGQRRSSSRDHLPLPPLLRLRQSRGRLCRLCRCHVCTTRALSNPWLDFHRLMILGRGGGGSRCLLPSGFVLTTRKWNRCPVADAARRPTSARSLLRHISAMNSLRRSSRGLSLSNSFH